MSVAVGKRGRSYGKTNDSQTYLSAEKSSLGLSKPGLGNLPLLKWLREQGCPWNKNTCSYAAERGQLEVLKWAREHGCPWDEYTCHLAAREGHLELLKWAHENGSPTNKLPNSLVFIPASREMREWAHEKGLLSAEWL